MALPLLTASFQLLPPLPTIKLGPSGADSQVGGFVYILGPCGSLQWTPVRLGVSPLAPQPPQVSSISGLRLYFPTLELWVVQSVAGSTSCCLASQLQPCLPHSTIPCLAGSTSHHLVTSPLCLTAHLRPSYWSEWMSSLFPWLSDFHTVQFSVSSGWFLSLNCCCPSFGYERRHSESTYTYILARCFKKTILILIIKEAEETVGREVYVNLFIVYPQQQIHSSIPFLLSPRCWLHTQQGFVWTFLGPVCIIISVSKGWHQSNLPAQLRVSQRAGV